MKTLRKIVLGLLAFLIFAAVCIVIFSQVVKLKQDKKVVTDSEVDTVLIQNDRFTAPFSGFSRLNQDEQKAYIRLTKEINSHNEEIMMGENKINVDNLARIWSAIMQDNPQYFWLSDYSYHYNEETYEVTQINMSFLYDHDEVKRRQLEIDAAIKGLTAGVTADMDDYTKVKTIHDGIIKGTEYDLMSDDNQNICSVFIGKKSVCAGYSKAMQYVLNSLGINATYISGEVISRGPHAWNMVEMDGEIYYIDATWDDPSFEDASVEDPDNIDYTYFGITTDELLKTHIIDGSLGSYPIALATANNYFVRENRVFDLNNSGEKQRFITDLKTAMIKNEPQICVKFTSPEMIDQALSLIEYSDVLVANTSIQYRRDDINQVLTFLFDR